MSQAITGTYDLYARVVKGGTPTNEKASIQHQNSEYHDATFGGASDLWGTSWAAADLDSMRVHVRSMLGDTVAGNFAIDAMRVTVHYVDPNGVPRSKSIQVGVGLGL